MQTIYLLHYFKIWIVERIKFLIFFICIFDLKAEENLWMCLLFLRLNYLLHELEPWGYHLVNILLHALVSILYYKVSLAFVSHNVKVAKICSYLFAVHPVHTEAVTGVVGRAELLSSVFFLLTILTYKNAVFKGKWQFIVWKFLKYWRYLCKKSR